MAEHDSSYRKFFSHPRMVQDLLLGYVEGEWVEDLDFSTLERVETSFVSDKDQRREADVIWRLRFKERWLYVYLLLEFQSRPDRLMALRMLVYSGLLYQNLYREGQLSSDEPLPPVLPVVLYNGNGQWQAAQCLNELQAALPEPLQRYQPQQQYLLIDENRYTALKDGNIVSTIFALESSPGPEAAQQVLTALIDWLNEDDSQSVSLKRVFRQWLVYSLFPKRLAGESIPAVGDLSEVKNMLADRIEHWSRRWKDEGHAEGRKEGLQKGIKRGLEEGQRLEASRILSRLLEKRFGPLTAEQNDRLTQLSVAEVESATERLFEAQSVEDVLG